MNDLWFSSVILPQTIWHSFPCRTQLLHSKANHRPKVCSVCKILFQALCRMRFANAEILQDILFISGTAGPFMQFILKTSEVVYVM